MKKICTFASFSFVLCTASALTAPAHADNVSVKIAPGLWESDQTMLINGQNMIEMMRKQMEKSLASMPPDQRASIEKSLSNSGMSGKTQYCVTAAQVAKGMDVDAFKKKLETGQKNCNVNIISANEKGGKFNAICNMKDGTTSNSTGEYVVKSDKEWTYNMVGDSNKGMAGAVGAPGGKTHVTIEAHSVWVGSDCGNIKSIE